MHLKWNTRWLALPLLILALSSCEEDLLTEDPTVIVNPATFYNNLEQAELAMAGVYAIRQQDFGYVDDRGAGVLGFAIMFGTLGTDEVYGPPWAPPGRKALDQHTVTPSVDDLFTMWSNHYKGIGVVNSFLANLERMTEDQIDVEDQLRLAGEAKVVRAMLYFNMVRMWGDVPLVLEERTNLTDDLEPSQVSQEEIYAQIIQDLQEASAGLEYRSGTGRVTKGAAEGLLGRVYLTMAGEPLNKTERYADAATAFENVIQSGEYSLVPNFRDVFTIENELNPEMVQVIEHDGPKVVGGGQRSALGTFYGPNGFPGCDGGGWTTAWVTTKFEAEFERNDPRRRVSIAYHNSCNVEQDSVEPVGRARPWKWQKPFTNDWQNDTPFDFPYQRYSEILLGFAEAKAQELGGPNQAAYSAVNAVRARARGEEDPATVLPALPTDLSLDEFIEAVWHERTVEFAFEGQRRSDLIRQGRLGEELAKIDHPNPPSAGNPDFQPCEIFLPVPQKEIDLNKNLRQNPCYQ